MKHILLALMTLTAGTASAAKTPAVPYANQKLVSDYCVSTTVPQVVQDLRKKGWTLTSKSHAEGLGWVYIVQKNPEYKKEGDQQYALYKSVPRCKIVTKTKTGK